MSPTGTPAGPARETPTVSLAEAAWRTGLASSPAEMRDVAQSAGALTADGRVDLRPFLGEPVPAAVPKARTLGAYGRAA